MGEALVKSSTMMATESSTETRSVRGGEDMGHFKAFRAAVFKSSPGGTSENSAKVSNVQVFGISKKSRWFFVFSYI